MVRYPSGGHYYFHTGLYIERERGGGGGGVGREEGGVKERRKKTKKLESYIQRRTQALLRSPPELMEPFQVVRYPSRGHYYFHTGLYI